MPSSRRAPARKKRRGFSLIELLVVVVIVGLTVTLGLSGILSAVKRQRLGTAANEVASLASRVLMESQNRNTPVFLVFGNYVAGVGTDVAIVRDSDTDGDLADEAFDPANIEGAAATVVLARTRIPPEIFLSRTSATAAAVWATTTQAVELRMPDADPTAPDLLFSRSLWCDFKGRAQVPGTTPTMTRGTARVQLTHSDMVTGSLTPMVTYTVSISPLFKASVSRIP